MDKAVQLDDNTSKVYTWGLELYQPKWFSDSARLSGIAEKATSATYDTANDADDVADELDNVAQALPDPEYKTMADVVRANAVSAFRAVVAKNPDDGAKHWGLAYALAASDDQSDLREATKEYRIALHFLPNSAALHYELSEVLRRRGKSALQVAELQRAVRLYPSYLDAVLQLGCTLKHETRFSEALPDLLLASRLAPADADTHNALGDLYSLKHEKNLSLTEFSEALKYSIYDLEAWSSLVYELDEAGRYQDSIDAATNALYYFSEIEPSDTLDVSDVYLNISDDYLHLKQWNKSLAASHKSLALNSTETMSQENIAEAEWGKGDSAAAKSQWKFVVSLHDPQVSPIAAKMLAEHS